MTGRSISHYQVQEELGQGGMGVVYKAHDTKLERTVALKFLAAHALESPEHKARFVHEAKAAAALNHPNICTIYEIDHANDHSFIAMEWIEGGSLKDKVDRRPLALSEAVNIAIQVGQGLQAAHTKGIAHRDIKSTNIMTTAGGQVKIMDFGLAQLAERTRITATGTRLGTPAYMSPEQAQAGVVDHRTDVWSLAVVLYEMITGQLPFKGEIEQAVLYSILNDEPEPLTALRSGVPVVLDQVIGKALRKNPDERYQHIDEMLVDLRAVQKRLESRLPEVESRLVSVAKSPRLLWLLSASSVLVAIILAVLYFGQTSVQLRPARFVIPPPEGTTLSGSIAVSPDGKQLSFAATGRDGITALWVRPFASLDAYKLPETEGAAHPFWSPDNRFVGFFAGRKLKKIRVEGGPPQILCEVFDARGGTWNRDGVIVFSPNVGSPLYRIDSNGGAPVPVTALDQDRQESSHQWPQFLQDGRHFLYLVSSDQAPARGIYFGSLDSTEKKRLLESDRSVAFTKGEGDLGYLLFLRGRTLMAHLFDKGAQGIVGEAFPVAYELWYDGTTPGLAAFSVSDDGVLAFRSGGVRNTQLRWFDRAGNPLEIVGPPGTYRDPSLAPDEETVAVARMDPETGTHDVWLFELSRGTVSRLTFYPGEETTPIWAPDGGQIAFSSNQDGQPNLYLKAASGSQSEEELLPSDVSKYPTDWSAHGNYLVFAKWDPKTSWDLWLLPAEGDREPLVYLRSDFDAFQAQFSPDGRWIAYTSNESGEYQVYVQPFPMREEKRQISTSGGAQPQWRRDGTELFYLARDGTLMAVDVKSGARFEPGLPKPLFRTQVTGLTNARNHYVSSADGQRFLVNTIIEEGASSPIRVLFGRETWLTQ